ncbi:hypothetical protein LOK74_13335 [Brevibacillus humidisoli]|uniref:SPOR domain-containing protein n=1 Tax=Brevibacillus humidisoli TaxID=2895522 RepID=UPI001E577495|nr:hypothetical protein [Brevibacillus humidisoli]UFJ39059.1 hypothetical protein LOK74_13335 [Brevibacillus humidisoli]
MEQKKHRISIRLNGTQLDGQEKTTGQTGSVGRPHEQRQELPFPFAEEATGGAMVPPATGEQLNRDDTLQTEQGESSVGPGISEATERLSQLRSTRIAEDVNAGHNERNERPTWDNGSGWGVEWSDQELEHGLLTGRISKKSQFGGGRFFDQRNWAKMLIASASAVAIGLCFGFIVLSIFSDDKLSQSYRYVLDGTMQTLTAAPEDGQAEQAEANQMDAAGEKPDEAPVSQEGAGEPLQLPELHAFMAQVGAFQDAASAEIAMESLEKQGYPQLLYAQDGQHYLFVAAAPSRDEILGIASVLKEKAIDVYVKEVTFPGFSGQLDIPEKKTAEDPAVLEEQSLQSFFSTGAQLVDLLTEWSAQRLTQPGAASSAGEEETKLKELHLRFLEQNRLLQPVLPEEWKAPITEMVSGLNQAMTAFSKANTANVQSYAWQVQDGVLLYIERYVSFLQKQQSQEEQSQQQPSQKQPSE